MRTRRACWVGGGVVLTLLSVIAATTLDASVPTARAPASPPPSPRTIARSTSTPFTEALSTSAPSTPAPALCSAGGGEVQALVASYEAGNGSQRYDVWVTNRAAVACTVSEAGMTLSGFTATGTTMTLPTAALAGRKQSPVRLAPGESAFFGLSGSNQYACQAQGGTRPAFIRLTVTEPGAGSFDIPAPPAKAGGLGPYFSLPCQVEQLVVAPAKRVTGVTPR